jgi:hypothetical protein
MSLEDTESKITGPVTLNVGGTKFTTTVSTLTSQKDNFFDGLFSGKFPIVKEADGSIFIDRSPTYFGNILDYLRNSSKWSTNLEKFEKQDIEKMLLETEFYQLTELTKLLAAELALYNRVIVVINGSENSVGSYYARELLVELILNNFVEVTRMNTKCSDHTYIYVSNKQTVSWSKSIYNNSFRRGDYAQDLSVTIKETP